MTDQQHVEALAARLGARLIYDVQPGTEGRFGPRASLESREVHLVPWGWDIEPGQYWSALHELGHIATTSVDEWRQIQAWGDRRGVVRTEAEAWQWALENAHRPLDEGGRTNIAYALSSYFYNQGIHDIPAARTVVQVVGPDVSLDAYLSSPYYWIARNTWQDAVARLAGAA